MPACLLILVSLLALSCQPSSPPSAEQCIYARLFAERVLPKVVAANSVSGLEFDPYLPKDSRIDAILRRELGASDILIGAFRRANASPTTLRLGEHFPNGVTVLPTEYIASFMDGGGGGWEAFHKAHPGGSGFATVSRVGVHLSEGVALVYVARHSGGLSGSGEFVMLRFIKGEWLVERSTTVWVA